MKIVTVDCRSDYINEVLHETVDDDDKANLPDDWEEGLTFTAKTSRKYSYIAHIWTRFSFRLSIVLFLRLFFEFFPSSFFLES